MRASKREREGKKERQNECVRKKGGVGGGGRETHREDRKTDGEKDRQTQREGHTERVREGERAGKKHDRHILCYKMYKTLHGIKHHTQSQSTFTFYLIKPYQPFNQTRTLHDQTTFLLSLYIYSHISHSSQSYGQQ